MRTSAGGSRRNNAATFGDYNPNPVVLVLDGFFDAGFCELVRGRMDEGDAEPAGILVSGTDVDVTVRRAGSIDIDEMTLVEVEARLDHARTDLARAFDRTLGAREGTSFLRYAAGGFYLPHVDRADDPSWPDAARREIAVVVFLNDDFTGGALHIIDAGETITPRAGRLAAFDAGLLHEVEPVTAGVRDVVVDWFYRGQSMIIPARGVRERAPGTMASSRSLRRATS